MSIDEQHVALPKLYGAPAYARPPAAVATVAKPFDPDDLPIEAWQTEEDREIAANLPARAWAPGGTVVDLSDRNGAQGGHEHPGRALRPRPLSLRRIAGRLLGD